MGNWWLYKSCNANIYIFNANSEYQIFALKSIRFPCARTHILNGKWAYCNFSFRGVEQNLNGINQFQVLGEIKLLNQKSLQIKKTFLMRKALKRLSLGALLKQNRFERQNEMYKVKDVCRQLDLRQFKAEMSLFSKACLKYSQLYDNILIINFADSNENITLYYVGWQIHWETVIDFVQSHILSDSYQPFDLLCSLGDPRSGKTSSMELSAIFMSFFVHMIRPQCKNDFFCQNFTKIIRIDCLQFVTYELIGKLERIYELILLSIPQTQQQILTFQSHVKLKNVPAILGSIQDMFVKAKCYFVVNWDEAQTLNYVQDQSDTKNITNISKKDQIALGQFYKNVMICINSPCQHLMAASLSVALLSILSAIPVNGRGIMRCNQAIVTSFQDDDSMLLCVNNLVHRKEKERQTILQCAKAVLLLKQMTYTCANLDQIISRLDKCKGLTENQIQEIIYNTAVQIKRNKTLIAQEWLDQICNMADSNMEIFEYIAGTTRVPGDLLIKLCIRSINENGQIQFKLRDQSVLTAMQESLQLMRSKTAYNCILLQDCGNQLQQSNFKNMAEVQSVWDQFTIQSQSVTNLIELKQNFYFECEKSAKQYKLREKEKILEKTNNYQIQVQIKLQNKLFKMKENDSQYVITQKQFQENNKANQTNLKFLNDEIELQKQYLKDWEKKTNLSNLSQTAWENAQVMLIYISNIFSHYDILLKIEYMNILDQIFIGKTYNSSHSLIAKLQNVCKEKQK
ncbi:Hypothetical_protein [Hexamita inflata]|uniref:Hypothetical_protein n=1 Tax=Hexamita inflata TaxID=28002 RepID=A0AA86RBV4_9EUKA|nr:Hypothetical protein HINF_LOCUS57787 [Hexamita inflata]